MASKKKKPPNKDPFRLLESNLSVVRERKPTRAVRYVIEVWEPDDHKVVAASFDLPSPPATIAVGDYLDPWVWEGDGREGFALEVVRVLHRIWESGDVVTHQISVATRKVPKANVVRSGEER